MAASGIRRFTKPLGIRASTVQDERIRESHATAIRELQEAPASRGIVVEDLDLPEATNITIRHNFGRRARVFVSPVRGSSSSGRITEIVQNLATIDTNNATTLYATGFGATVTVDVWLL